jgi:ATP-dependent RNA helicase SUPV3L1/SUV3
VGRLAAPVEALERMDDLMRAGKPGQLTDADREVLGWSPQETKEILRALGFAPTTKEKAGEDMVWRRRGEAPTVKASAPSANSPFSALAALKDRPAPARRPRRRRKAKAATP